MSKPSDTPGFKKLFGEWNNKLIKSGHKEIENFNLPVPTLTKWSSSLLRRNSEVEVQAKQEHFRRATHLLNDFKFENRVHRRIWQLYTEGWSVRKIANYLKKKKYKKSRVFQIIQMIKKAM